MFGASRALIASHSRAGDVLPPRSPRAKRRARNDESGGGGGCEVWLSSSLSRSVAVHIQRVR